jgi:protein-disulfide isomerase
MASRTKQKEEARARRLAEEQARAEQARRNRRLQMLGGVLVIAIAIVAVAIAVSSGGGSTKVTRVKAGQTCKSATDSAVCNLLAGIPQSGNTVGDPKAPVTVIEYGDLECPICKDFATGGVEDKLISTDVKSGRVKLVYRSLETATQGAPDPGIFGPQQAAAQAAGLQDKEWDYIEFFYHYQGPEGTGYVNQSFLNKIATHVPGLNFSKWLSDSHSPAMLSQVTQDEQTYSKLGLSQVATPTLVISGPKGQAQPIQTVPTYSQLESVIKSVS